MRPPSMSTGDDLHEVILSNADACWCIATHDFPHPKRYTYPRRAKNATEMANPMANLRQYVCRSLPACLNQVYHVAGYLVLSSITHYM